MRVCRNGLLLALTYVLVGGHSRTVPAEFDTPKPIPRVTARAGYGVRSLIRNTSPGADGRTYARTVVPGSYDRTTDCAFDRSE